MSRGYWKELLEFISKMAEFGMISANDVNFVYSTDSVGEAVEHIRKNAIDVFGLKLRTRIRRHFAWLGERALGAN